MPVPCQDRAADVFWDGRIFVTAAPRDVEQFYSTSEVVAKLRRLADALETNKRSASDCGRRIRVPARAQFSIEHERDDGERRSSSAEVDAGRLHRFRGLHRRQRRQADSDTSVV